MTKRRRRARAQRSFDFRRRTRAGKLAKKPGRKPDRNRRDPLHRPRPELDAAHPIHVVFRVTPAVRTLRRRRAYQAFRRALATTGDHRTDCRIVHISIQSSHVHLLVEAEHKRALARGMQGFAISAAKRLNQTLGRSGRVFAYRYHATAITSPTQARSAIAYVINNWRHHRADAGSPWRVDPFASGWSFSGWTEPHGHPPLREPLPVVLPATWLLADGWRRAGPIRLDEVPGPELEG